MNDTTKDTDQDIDNTTNQDDLADDWAAALSEQKASEASDQAAGLQDFAAQASEPEANDNTEDASSGVDMDDWAAALAEQSAGEAESASAEDDWSAALAEQTAGEAAAAATPPPVAKPAPDLFKPLNVGGSGGNSEIDMVMDIPVQLSVELGRTKLTIKNILQLGQGSVVELDGLAGEPMDIYVNGYLIAQGEVVVVEDKYGIRITDIITPSDRINRLNSRR